MTLRVHHYYPCGTGNSGDELVALALRQALTRRLGPCDFVSIPATQRCEGVDRPPGLCAANVRHSNAEADLVLVGGSNLLEPRKSRGRHDCNIPLVIDGDAVRQLARPLLLAGMGTGSSFGSRIRDYQPAARDNLRLLFDRALGHAVRDTTTVRELRRIDIATECTGCPVTFLTDRPVAAQPSSRPLLVSFPPARILKKFLGPHFMRLAMEYVRGLRAEGVPVVVTLHEPVDVEPARALVSPGTEVFYTPDVGELIARFEDCRGVVGFRLHAGLLGLGLGKPIVAVGVDWRGLAFIETAGLHDASIRPFRLGQGAKLRRVTRLLLDNDAGYLHRLAAVKDGLRARHEAFFAKVAARLRPLARTG